MASNMSDGIMAELLGMGFDTDMVTACKIAMDSSNTPITLQSATEWLLKNSQSHTQQTTPTLRLGSSQDHQHVDFSQPISSGSSLSHGAAPAPIRSRYDLTDEKRKHKEAMIAKEREDALKKAREKRLSDMKAKAVVKQQIEEDRQRRLLKMSKSEQTTQSQPIKTNTAASTNTKQCRVQVRLPNGSMLRHVFPIESTLNDVCNYIAQSHPRLTSVRLVQPFPHKDFTEDEHSQTLQDLGLHPSASLVISKDKSLPSPHPPAPNEMETASQDEPESPQEEDMEVEEGVRTVHFPPRRSPPDDPGQPGRVPPPGGMFPPRGMPPPMGMFQPQRGMSFEGEGHRLGGRNIPMKFGDPQSMSEHVTTTARAAAEKRAQIISKLDDEKVKLSPDVPTLEVICLRYLSRLSSVNCLPNCSNLPPRAAQRLLMSLKETKQLHPKTLNVFLKCPIQSLVLDNYSFATNQLIEMLRYFPSLTHLSLASCTLITDKSMMQLLPYLTQLISINLNGCHQLSDDIFKLFRGQSQLCVIKLSHVKMTDAGVYYLSSQPLVCLNEIDLSFTDITHKTIERLGQAAPNIQILNVESTKVANLDPLLLLKNLHTLSVSKCPIHDISVLAHCSMLNHLNISNIALDVTQLQFLSNLHQLTSLKLPDKDHFFDEHMPVIADLPLQSLDLTGYGNITDVGIGHISKMDKIAVLSLSRTKLTDDGMIYLQGLCNLKQLSLDYTFITDRGMLSICDLDNLEDLSISDTRVTSQFILDGAMEKLSKLTKLNLVRTFVDDQGLLALKLPSLVMLNIDWTCASNRISIEMLHQNGCTRLETLRNKNIEQPTLEQQQQQQQQQVRGVAAPPINNYDDDNDDDYDDSDDDY